jgi:hypothetical protein
MGARRGIGQLGDGYGDGASRLRSIDAIAQHNHDSLRQRSSSARRRSTPRGDERGEPIGSHGVLLELAVEPLVTTVRAAVPGDGTAQATEDASENRTRRGQRATLEVADETARDDGAAGVALLELGEAGAEHLAAGVGGGAPVDEDDGAAVAHDA